MFIKTCRYGNILIYSCYSQNNINLAALNTKQSKNNKYYSDIIIDNNYNDNIIYDIIKINFSSPIDTGN